MPRLNVVTNAKLKEAEDLYNMLYNRLVTVVPPDMITQTDRPVKQELPGTAGMTAREITSLKSKYKYEFNKRMFYWLKDEIYVLMALEAVWCML